MVLLLEEQLLLEILILCLQVQLSDIGVIGDINDLLEPIDVTLHRLACGKRHLILDSEVLSRKVDIVHRTCKNLSPQVLNGLEIMPPVSDLGSLLLQVSLDFDLQSPVISLQASHPLQVSGQAVIQALHSFLLALDAPVPTRVPAISTAKHLDLQLPCLLVEWDTEI